MSSFHTRTAPKASPQSLRGLWPFLHPYRGRIALAGFFLVAAAVSTLLFPIALRQLIDNGLLSSDRASQTLALQGHFMELFGVVVALGIFSAARFYTVSWLGERVSADLKNAVYARVLQQSPVFFETTQTGEVISRLSADTSLIHTVVGSSLSMGLRNVVMGLGALALLIWNNPYVMGQVLGVLLLVVVPSMWFGRRVRRLSRTSQDRLADSSALAAEVINAISTVQSEGAQERETQRFDASTQGSFESAVRRSKARAVLVAFIIVATFGALLWGLYQGTQAVLAGQISAGHLGQTVVYIIILASAFAVLGEIYGDLQRAAGATERLMELLHHEPAIQSPPFPAHLAPQLSAETPPEHRWAVHYEAVQFHYPSRPKQAALQDFSLRIAPGETVALVGASGAGKTTVFQLLLRFYDPQAGAIYLNGVPITSLNLQTLRQHIALVPQDPVIFSSSVLDNIRYARPQASEQEVRAAAHAAFADDFIQQLPQDYQTFVGERGVRLSGGQKQRLALARAFLKGAPLLLLDEATSALDAHSEKMIQAALDAAIGHQGRAARTTLVIAHRLATVKKVDRIVVLEHGRVVETGSHESLIRQGGVYAHLAALQFGAQDESLA